MIDDLVTCAKCGGQTRRDRSWQRFTMLRHVGTKGGGRQRTMAGRGTDEFLCTVCAHTEDVDVKRGITPARGDFDETSRLAL